VWDIAFHPTSPDNVITCGGEGWVLLWNFNRSNQQFGRRRPFETDGEENIQVDVVRDCGLSANSFDVNPDENSIAIASDNETLIIKTHLL